MTGLTATSSCSHGYERTSWLKMARELAGCNPYPGRAIPVQGCHLYEVADTVIEAHLCSCQLSLTPLTTILLSI